MADARWRPARLRHDAYVPTAQRSVTSLPLTEVWDTTGALPLTSGEQLDRSAVEGLLRSGTVRLVLADVGKPLEWVSPAKARSVWRSEVSERLVGPDRKGFLDDFNDAYFYRAHAWVDEAGEVSAVVLERHH